MCPFCYTLNVFSYLRVSVGKLELYPNVKNSVTLKAQPTYSHSMIGAKYFISHL